MERFQIGIIGAGIVGLATALAFIRRGAKSLVILEAENAPGTHQSGHNSGVIHSGLYYPAGSAKASNCRSGRIAMYDFCETHGVPHRCCGKLVVAVNEEELPALDRLAERGRKNGLQIEMLDAAAIQELEPHINALQGIWVPETGIVDYRQVTAVMARLIAAAEGKILCNHRVQAISVKEKTMLLQTNNARIECEKLINCAGLQSDRIARMCGETPELRIIPFRGEYYQLKKEKAAMIRHPVYPVPDTRFPFLGVHFTPMIGGGVEAGPNAVLALRREGYGRYSFHWKDAWESFSYPGFRKLAGKYWRMGLLEMQRSYSKTAFVRAMQRLAPAIQSDDVLRSGSGVRAQAVTREGKLVDDFHILRSGNIVHVLNAPSPAATASLPIGESIAAMCST